MYHSFFFFFFLFEVEKNKIRGQQHRNYSEILIQRKTENEERMQFFSTGSHFNDIEFLFLILPPQTAKTTITHTGQSNAILMATCE